MTCFASFANPWRSSRLSSSLPQSSQRTAAKNAKPKTWRTGLILVNVFSPPSTCGEVLDGALHPVARPIGFHRVDCVVIGCPRLETVHAHAENGIGMARVQPDGRFRGLAELLGIRTIVHDSVMLRRSPGVLA